MRGTNDRRRWWSQAVAAAQLFPETITDAGGEQTVAYDFKLHELRQTAASLTIQAGANIKALQNMLGHESAGLTLDRYGHLLRLGRRGGWGGDERAFNWKVWSKCGHGD
jgi:integrase